MLEATQSRAKDQLDTTRSAAKERAQRAAQQRLNDAMEEFGQWAFDSLEERFPEQAKARRRRERIQLLVAGFVIGFLVRHVLNQRS